MVRLNNKQIINYLHRSFTAVDGLWFLKVEDKYTFDEALKIDQEVWEVMPKIQARMLKSFGNLDDGMEALCDCLTTKLVLDGFKFKTVSLGNGFKKACQVVLGNLYAVRNILYGHQSLMTIYILSLRVISAKAPNRVYSNLHTSSTSWALFKNRFTA